jgi:hypothetical protein
MEEERAHMSKKHLKRWYLMKIVEVGKITLK